MHIAQKFEALLKIYRRPDGRKWSGQEIDEATGGVVSRSYVTNLRKGPSLATGTVTTFASDRDGDDLR
jgi:hypothetical protein